MLGARCSGHLLPCPHLPATYSTCPPTLPRYATIAASNIPAPYYLPLAPACSLWQHAGYLPCLHRYRTVLPVFAPSPLPRAIKPRREACQRRRGRKEEGRRRKKRKKEEEEGRRKRKKGKKLLPVPHCLPALFWVGSWTNAAFGCELHAVLPLPALPGPTGSYLPLPPYTTAHTATASAQPACTGLPTGCCRRPRAVPPTHAGRATGRLVRRTLPAPGHHHPTPIAWRLFFIPFPACFHCFSVLLYGRPVADYYAAAVPHAVTLRHTHVHFATVACHYRVPRTACPTPHRAFRACAARLLHCGTANIPTFLGHCLPDCARARNAAGLLTCSSYPVPCCRGQDGCAGGRLHYHVVFSCCSYGWTFHCGVNMTAPTYLHKRTRFWVVHLCGRYNSPSDILRGAHITHAPRYAPTTAGATLHAHSVTHRGLFCP